MNPHSSVCLTANEHSPTVWLLWGSFVSFVILELMFLDILTVKSNFLLVMLLILPHREFEIRLEQFLNVSMVRHCMFFCI